MATKQEAHEAIDNTIVPNGEKGITAHSFNITLHTMVDAIPEGGSGGGVLMLQADIDGSGNPAFTDNQIANNKAVFNHILENYGTAQQQPVFFLGYPVSILVPGEIKHSAFIFMPMSVEPLEDAVMGEGTLIGVPMSLDVNSDGTIDIEM